MKTTLLILSIVLFQLKLSCQIERAGIQSIILMDHQNNNYDSWYATKYEIQVGDHESKLYMLERSFHNIPKSTLRFYGVKASKRKTFIRTINNQFIDSLVISLNLQKDSIATLKRLVKKCQSSLKNIDSINSEFFADSLSNTQIELFEKATKDSLKLYEIIKSILRLWTLSDYPSAYLEIIYESDTSVVFSENQNPYMIPWKIGSSSNYNIDISSHIAHLIPSYELTNKYRIEGENWLLRLVIRDLFRTYCEPKILENRFRRTISDSMAMFLDSFEIFEFYLYSTDNCETCWTMKMSYVDSVSQFRFWVSFKKDEEDIGIRSFNQYHSNAVMSIQQVPFITEILEQNPHSFIQINFTRTTGIGKRDIERLNRVSPYYLGKIINEHKNTAISFELHAKEGSSHWYLLPSGKLYLFLLIGESPLDKIEDHQLSTSSDYEKICLKEISKNGELAR